jgi:hypothetical protein
MIPIGGGDDENGGNGGNGEGNEKMGIRKMMI